MPTLTIRICILVLLFTISGCSSLSSTKQAETTSSPFNTKYCDSYFIYDMCAEDMDSDGVTDVIYFSDSREVFLLNPELSKEKANEFDEHKCIQLMDNEMISASSELHRVNDQTGMMKRNSIKARLMLNYTRFMPFVNRCMGNEYAMPEGDDFGDEDFDDF